MSKQDEYKYPVRKPVARLREWRIHQGKTLLEVGEAMGVHKAQVSNWETGIRQIPEKKLVAYCEAIGIDIISVYKEPNYESIDALLVDATPEQRAKALMLVKVLLERN